ncbi:MAG TPA: sugar transferase [Polyangiaceae bacterium]|jgi:lipopolysaccharide/colanic/teichoic acid biosynthesis glycosyltransferase|nr:sugar transferase [Polyangiaceae bacterium]
MSTVGKLSKRLLDVSVAASALTLTTPLWLLGGVGTFLTLGRPVLFRQERAGLHGRAFSIFKFRTMRKPRPEDDPIAHDFERLTPFGRWLRSTSIDELPSLLNVLKGEMSLVGPRPLLLRYLERYSAEQARRHEVPPGLTGWAQVRGRNRTTWEQRFTDDVWYVDHHTLALDVWILVLTLWRVVQRSGVDAGPQTTMPEFMGTRANDQ